MAHKRFPGQQEELSVQNRLAVRPSALPAVPAGRDTSPRPRRLRAIKENHIVLGAVRKVFFFIKDGHDWQKTWRVVSPVVPACAAGVCQP